MGGRSSYQQQCRNSRFELQVMLLAVAVLEIISVLLRFGWPCSVVLVLYAVLLLGGLSIIPVCPEDR